MYLYGKLSAYKLLLVCPGPDLGEADEPGHLPRKSAEGRRSNYLIISGDAVPVHGSSLLTDVRRSARTRNSVGQPSGPHYTRQPVSRHRSTMREKRGNRLDGGKSRDGQETSFPTVQCNQ